MIDKSILDDINIVSTKRAKTILEQQIDMLEVSREISEKLSYIYRLTLERCIKLNSGEPAKRLFELEERLTKNKPVSESLDSLEKDIEYFIDEVESWEE